MAITFRAVATATTGATPANTLTIAKPVGTADGDALICDMLISSASSFVPLTAPPGWFLVSQVLSSAGACHLLRFGRCGKAADPTAGWTWVFDVARNAVGVIRAYYDSTASTTCRICSIALVGTPSATTHDTPATLVSNVASQWVAVAYGAAQQDTWTQDAAITERSDGTTTSGTSDICLSTGDAALGGTGAINPYTAALDSAVAAEGATLVSVITSMGMHQPSGTGNAVTIHDNAKMDNAADFSLAEMRRSYPADLREVGTSGAMICYELDDSVGTGGITIGQATSPQTTTWKDKNVQINMNARSMATSASNLSSWRIELGTKVGTGDEAGAVEGVVFVSSAALTTLFRGHLKLYALKIRASANAVTIANGAASLDGDIIGVEVEHVGGGSLTLGSSTFPLANVYDFEARYSEGAAVLDMLAGVFATKAKKFRLSGTGLRSFLGGNTANAYNMVDVEIDGDPTDGVIRFGGSSANNWALTSWIWRGTGNKFNVVSSGFPTLANAFKDRMRVWAKVHDVTGAPLSAITFKLTDLLGNVIVNTTTDANGYVVFGSGQDAQAVIAADWYAVGTTPTIRHRSPFTIKINEGAANATYEEQIHVVRAPGYEGVTTTAGNFADIYLDVTLGPPTVAAGPPSPVLVADIPIEAPGEIRVQMTIPSS